MPPTQFCPCIEGSQHTAGAAFAARRNPMPPLWRVWSPCWPTRRATRHGLRRVHLPGHCSPTHCLRLPPWLLQAGANAEALSHEEYFNGPGETYTVTFKEAGSYSYYCEPHQGAGTCGCAASDDDRMLLPIAVPCCCGLSPPAAAPDAAFAPALLRVCTPTGMKATVVVN